MNAVPSLKPKSKRSDKIWKHWLFWLGDEVPYGSDLSPIKGWNPNDWRDAFDTLQTHGSKYLTDEENFMVSPLVRAQVIKEITINCIVHECMESWCMGFGWYPPLMSILEPEFRPPLYEGQLPYDELTLLAFKRIKENIEKDPHDFFMRTPSISPQSKQKLWETRILTLKQ